MKRSAILPLDIKLLAEEQKILLINAAIQSLYWISPVVNPRCGQVEPGAEFKRNGMIAYADGVNWNPGNGKGLYRYDNGWVRIG